MSDARDGSNLLDSLPVELGVVWARVTYSQPGCSDTKSCGTLIEGRHTPVPRTVLAHVKDMIQQIQVQLALLHNMEYYNTVAYNNIT